MYFYNFNIFKCLNIRMLLYLYLYYIYLYITVCMHVVYVDWCRYMCDYKNNEGNE